MQLMDMLDRFLSPEQCRILREKSNMLTQVRLRISKPLYLEFLDGSEICGGTVLSDQLQTIANHLMQNSLYACESELKNGYFTAKGGMRVGVCGRIKTGGQGIENLSSIGSMCIRIPREIKGCADPLFQVANREKPPNLLILSAPGLGKTTLLRDYIRQVSDSGLNVGIADERREIAACLEGVPQLDVGSRSDVLDGCPKEYALEMLIRACSPDMVAVDEIGSEKDALALSDAAKSGVSIAATAHARDIGDAYRRKNIQMMLNSGIFDWYVVLGDQKGRIKTMRKCADEG